MLAVVIALLVICLGAAVAGAVVPGLFWLTVVSLAGLLLTGAVGVSMVPGPADAGSPAARRPQLRVIGSADGGRHRAVSQAGGELSRAA